MKASELEIEVGRILPKFVTPEDVRDLKVRVDPFVRAMDSAIASCATLPDDMRAGWATFSKAWRTYFDEEDSWWHTAAQMDQGEAYERDLARWQDLLAKWNCAQNAPRITPSTEGGGGADGKEWASALKVVGIAGIGLAVVLGLRTVLR